MFRPLSIWGAMLWAACMAATRSAQALNGNALALQLRRSSQWHRLESHEQRLRRHLHHLATPGNVTVTVNASGQVGAAVPLRG